MEDLNKKKGKKNKINYVIIALISLLLIFSVAQAFEINNLKDNLNVGSSVSSSPVSSSRVASPVRSQSPAMVGGC